MTLLTLWPAGNAPSTDDTLVGLKSLAFLVMAAPRSAGSEKFSTVHSLVSESLGLYHDEPMRRRVPFSGSEHTQFSPSSAQRRSAAREDDLNVTPARKVIKQTIVILAESIPIHLPCAWI